jgi:adenosine deaminase
MFTDEYNEQIFREACDNNWNKLIGFDFVQEEDKYDSLERFDPIVDKVLRDYPHLSHLKKVYHAGETSNHFTDNIDVAVKAGTVRLGHGLNILQRIEFLPHCKHVCFEKNPISNLLLGYKSDLREASAPILLGLGYPVSLSPDDPGKFGLEDTTADYFIAALSYNWSLRHLKLIGYHSINHAVCEEGVKARLIKSF